MFPTKTVVDDPIKSDDKERDREERKACLIYVLMTKIFDCC